jgi:hypothetical protein
VESLMLAEARRSQNGEAASAGMARRKPLRV